MKIHTCALLVTLAPLSVVTSSQGSKPILPGVASLAAQEAVSPAEAHEELLGELPEGTRLIRLNLVVSRAGRHAAWVAKQGVAETVVVNGRPVAGPVFEEIDRIVISYAGDHVAWSGKRGKSWVVILDGQPVGPEYDSVEHLAFAPDGRLTFVARRTDKTGILVVDGKEIGPAAREMARPLFSPLGRRIAQAVRLADGWHFAIDGVPGPVIPFNTRVVGEPQGVFSLDGAHFAYGAGSGNVHVVADGTAGPEFNWVVLGLPFSPKGPRHAYVGVNTKGFKSLQRGTVVVDGVPGPVSEIGVKSDGRSLGGVTPPAFDSEGAHVVYAAMRGDDEWSVMLDGKPVPGFVVSGVQAGPVFDPRGQWALIGYSGKGDTLRVVEARDGKVVRSFPTERGLNFAERLTFSRSGDRIAYVLGRGGVMFSMAGGEGRAQRRVVVDGVEHATYDCNELDALQFSADGGSVAYRVNGLKAGAVKAGQSLAVLNGRGGRHYDEIFKDTLSFQADGRLSYTARDGRRMVRVTIERNR